MAETPKQVQVDVVLSEESQAALLTLTHDVTATLLDLAHTVERANTAISAAIRTYANEVHRTKQEHTKA